MTEGETKLLKSWDDLNSAIKRVEVSQMENVSEAVLHLEKCRKEMVQAIHDLFMGDL